MKLLVLTACVLVAQSICVPAWSRVSRVAELKAAYETLTQDGSVKSQMHFFDAFPSTGEQYELLFGYHPCLGDSSLYDQSYEMIGAFWSLPDVPNTMFYDKVVAVACALRYDADAAGQWQECIGNVLLKCNRQSESLIDRVALLSSERQMRFWSFVWSSSVDVDDRGLRDFNKGYIDEHYPQMVRVYVLARDYFYDGVNLASETPRNYLE